MEGFKVLLAVCFLMSTSSVEGEELVTWMDIVQSLTQT